MSLEEKVGQMFMLIFASGTVKMLRRLTRNCPGHRAASSCGVILFGRTWWTPANCPAVDQLQQAAGAIPLLIGVDQEGGVVNACSPGQ
jgi:beta-glucosidase-like glycosyl hydrolase